MKKLALGLLFAAACGDNLGAPLFTPKPECSGAAITPYQGSFQQVISKLSIGTQSDGFDLDGDGKPDNKLAAVSGLASSGIDDAFNAYDILIPIEFFDFDAVAADNCVKFAVYVADYATDADGDGQEAYVPEGDCNDKVAAIHRGATEDVDDGVDNDCDGLADEDAADVPSVKGNDDDLDGQTIAQGDCDDHNAMIKKGMPEICGDGLDNDCDGVADRSQDAAGNATACTPFDAATPVDLGLDPTSFDDAGAPLVAFKDGAVDGSNTLVAGPSVFSISIPVFAGVSLALRVTGATMEATLTADGTMSGRIGGVLDATTADTIRGLAIREIGLKPEDSLLDAAFANLLGPLLALPKARESITSKYKDCRTPDIDVDGDGIEAFCDSNLNDDDKTVDICIDGDGTVIKDTATAECAAAMKDGKPRFVDGISVGMNFETTKIKSIKPPM